MVARRVSEHTALTDADLATTDLVEVIDVSDPTDAASGTNKRMTLAEFVAGLIALGSLATDTELSTHASDTSSVHGITDTTALETTTGAQSKVDTHVNDTSAAHAASAISADSTTLVGTGTDVQAVLEELDNGIADHLADTSAAHAASAISADSTTLVGTGTDVQAVLEELDNAIAAAGGGLTPERTAGGTRYALPSTIAVAGGTAARSQNVLYFNPFYVSGAITIVGMQVRVTAQGAADTVGRLGIYETTAAFDGGGDLVLDAGTVSVATTGVKAITGLSTLLAPGWYLAALLHNGGGDVTFVHHVTQAALHGLAGDGHSTGNPQMHRISANQAYGVLPDPAPATTVANVSAEWGIQSMVLLDWTV